MGKDDKKTTFPNQQSEEYWREKLTPEQFRVCRLGGTEPAFTGKYHDSKTSGIYRCVCCGKDLFRSSDKFDSGSGWPSYLTPAAPGAVTSHEDRTLFLVRTEVRCANCGSHLGHVFPDGPPPSGMRYCINSAALRLEPSSGEEAQGEGEEE